MSNNRENICLNTLEEMGVYQYLNHIFFNPLPPLWKKFIITVCYMYEELSNNYIMLIKQRH